MSRLVRPRLRRLFATMTSATTVLALAAGCGLLGGSSDNQSSATGDVEKPKIKIAIIPATDMAPLWVAQKQGYFAEEGLEVEIVTKAGGGDVMTSLLGGDVDFAFASYPLVVQAQEKGRGAKNLKIVAEAAAATPENNAVVAKKDSPIRSEIDLQAKRIGVTSTGSIVDMAVMATLRSAKADFSKIDWRQMRFPDMLPKLQSGEIDAAFLVEPFITIAQSQLGVWIVSQPMTGPLDGMPLTGYLALESTTKDSPKTVAAFQRVIQKVHREAATQKGEDAIRQALIEFANVKSEIAPVVHLPAYPITTDPTRLQRVPDLMKEFGLIQNRFDIKPLIASSAS
jgi:NitT/TauT family transport system substrate-binding protein